MKGVYRDIDHVKGKRAAAVEVRTLLSVRVVVGRCVHAMER
jgi:hypothetical protein